MQHFNAWKNNIMLSKAQLKLIKSLEQKKFRKESGLFVAEGGKTVGDLLACGLECKLIIADKEWMESNTLPTKHKITEVSSDDIKKASFLRMKMEKSPVFSHGTFDVYFSERTQSRRGGWAQCRWNGW